jgi:hypothetical protein
MSATERYLFVVPSMRDFDLESIACAIWWYSHSYYANRMKLAKAFGILRSMKTYESEHLEDWTDLASVFTVFFLQKTGIEWSESRCVTINT